MVQVRFKVIYRGGLVFSNIVLQAVVSIHVTMASALLSGGGGNPE